MNVDKVSPPEQESQPKTEQQDTQQTNEALDQPEAPHKAFQVAYEEYFQRLNKISEEAQRRILDAQFEYQRALQEAWQAQDQKAFQDANENFQHTLETAANDTTHLQSYADAYEEYKSTVQKAFANASGKEFEPMTLSAIAQSISIVAQAASQIPRPQ